MIEKFDFILFPNSTNNRGRFGLYHYILWLEDNKAIGIDNGGGHFIFADKEFIKKNTEEIPCKYKNLRQAFILLCDNFKLDFTYEEDNVWDDEEDVVEVCSYGEDIYTAAEIMIPMFNDLMCDKNLEEVELSEEQILEMFKELKFYK